MAGATAAFPSAIYMMEMFDPTRPKRGLGSALRLSTFLGLCGGFLFAYQRSSFRFWGWRENEIEQQAHQAAIDAGVKPPGTDPSKSDLTPYLQGVAHRNSAFSQLKFSKLTWPTSSSVATKPARRLFADRSFSRCSLVRLLAQAHFLGSIWSTTHTTATTRRSRPRRWPAVCLQEPRAYCIARL